MLASFTLDLAEYRLRSRRPPAPKDAAERYARAIEWLRGVADCTIELPAAMAPAANTSRGPTVEMTGEPRTLDHDELSDF